MIRAIKWIIVGLVILYLVTWLLFVPTVNSYLLSVPERCLGKADKIHTPKPSGLSLFSPRLSYKTKVDLHSSPQHAYQTAYKLDTMVVPAAPFFLIYNYKLESRGLTCSGDGSVYLWWDGIKVKDNVFKTT